VAGSGTAKTETIEMVAKANCHSPQTRHSAERGGSGNGGILRVSAGAMYVAKSQILVRYGKQMSAKSLKEKWRERPDLNRRPLP
jgi:hypothetical protein